MLSNHRTRELLTNFNEDNMGEIADMHLDGTLCQYCGDFMHVRPPGYPVTCQDCQKGEESE
jgi:hypothetical protein